VTRRVSSLLAITFLLRVALPPHAFAQSTAARISGTVVDPSGAAVQNARVSATNLDTGWKVAATSNSEGRYALYPLPPGTYIVDFEKTGFHTYRIEQIQLYASDSVGRNAQLEVGAISQAVTVSSSVLVLNETPSTESTITEDQVNTLPLNGRDYNQLVLLGGGAVDPVAGVSYDLGSVAINGNRSYSNEYSVDGVSNTFTWQNISAVPLSVGLIREFKVISGVAPAEYGHGASNIVVVSKSGTNQFHGSLFEYYRGNTWIARDPFTFTPLAPFSRHQFGGSVGGPVRLPFYQGRNKTFFFANYEALRQTGGSTRVTTVPPDDFWKGDFSSLLPRVQLRDPMAPGRPVIPGNRLDQYLGGSRIDPIALKLRPLFAKATLPGLVNNSAVAVDALSNNDQVTMRIDHLLPRNQSLSARFTYSNARGYTPGIMGLPDLGYLNPSRGINGMLGWTSTLGARTVSEFRLGVSSFSRHYEYVVGNYPTAQSAGMLGFVPESRFVAPTPIFQFLGTDSFSSLSYWPSGGQNTTAYANNVYSLTEVLSHTRGKHQLKAGFDGRLTNLNFILENNGQGVVAFNGVNNNNSSGYSFADFLMGVVYTSQQTPLQSKVLLREPEVAFFAQDDWRLTRNFTFTFGVRNESFYHPDEERNRLAMFSPLVSAGGGIVVACSDGKLPSDQFNPGVISRLTNAQGNLPFPVVCGSNFGYEPRRLVKNKPWNPGPRVGFSWDPFGDGKWMVHSGYGIFYSRYPEQYIALTINANPPFASLLSYAQAFSNGVPSLSLRSPYNQSGAPSITPYGLDKDFRLPDSQQWNFTVQRMLGSNAMVSLAYLGNKGTHLFRSLNLNMQQVDPATGKIFRTYPNFGSSTVNLEVTTSNSTYHAMQWEVRRRFAHGLSYQANWTWAKGLDDVGFNATTAALDIQSLGRDRANSDYVRRHQINSNFTWELPAGRGHKFAGGAPRWVQAGIGGWRMSGIWRYTTGRYLTPSYTPPGSFASNNRPDVVYAVSSQLPSSERNALHWFNPAAFSVPPLVDPASGQPRFGNAGRNIILGPGLNRLDGSMSKIFPLRRETKRIVFRVDVFNVMNHPNWGNPNTNISSTNTVGVISSTNGSMRQAQFSLEFQF
jgi:Carboxypeptidase regulatory-like domain